MPQGNPGGAHDAFSDDAARWALPVFADAAAGELTFERLGALRESPGAPILTGNTKIGGRDHGAQASQRCGRIPETG